MTAYFDCLLKVYMNLGHIVSHSKSFFPLHHTCFSVMVLDTKLISSKQQNYTILQECTLLCSLIHLTWL